MILMVIHIIYQNVCHGDHFRMKNDYMSGNLRVFTYYVAAFDVIEELPTTQVKSVSGFQLNIYVTVKVTIR